MDKTQQVYNALQQHKAPINPFGALVQMYHETFYQGQPWASELCVKANNLAGLKASKEWINSGLPTYDKVSWEQEKNGTKVERKSTFRAYPTIEKFIEDYALKISGDYPISAQSADNFFGYWSGLFRGKWGAWATDQSYWLRLLERMVILAPSVFGDAWRGKVKAAYDFAFDNNRFASEVEERRVWDWLVNNIKGFDVKKATPDKTKPTNHKTVIIDPGHGGPRPGAKGMHGLLEKDVVLSVSLKLADLLAGRGVGTRLTRYKDIALASGNPADLAARAKMADEFKCDAFVSIHCNAADDRRANGFEVWTTPGQDAGDKLATFVFDAWMEQIKATARKDTTDGDPDKEAKFAVLKNSRPSCLVEMEFISNESGELRLGDPDDQAAMAKALADGICNFLGV